MNDVVKQRIKEAKQGRETKLDLSRQGLNRIPPEIKELDWLETLILRGNPLRDVSALSGLEGLTDLELSSTQVSDVSALDALVKRGLKIHR